MVAGSCYYTHRQDGAWVAPQAGAALAHFGRDVKGGDTCFFLPYDTFLAIFSRFFSYVTEFFPLCHLFLKHLKPEVWQLPYLPSFSSFLQFSWFFINTPTDNACPSRAPHWPGPDNVYLQNAMSR